MYPGFCPNASAGLPFPMPFPLLVAMKVGLCHFLKAWCHGKRLYHTILNAILWWKVYMTSWSVWEQWLWAWKFCRMGLFRMTYRFLCFSEIDECSTGFHQCVTSARGGVCTNSFGSYSCSCNSAAGFSGNGIQSGGFVGNVTGTGCQRKDILAQNLFPLCPVFFSEHDITSDRYIHVWYQIVFFSWLLWSPVFVNCAWFLGLEE